MVIVLQPRVSSTESLQEIEARITTRVFAAVHNPERAPAVRGGAGSGAGGARCHQPVPCPALGSLDCSPGGWDVGGIWAVLAALQPPALSIRAAARRSRGV